MRTLAIWLGWSLVLASAAAAEVPAPPEPRWQLETGG
jgi:hypothetical protein